MHRQVNKWHFWVVLVGEYWTRMLQIAGLSLNSWDFLLNLIFFIMFMLFVSMILKNLLGRYSLIINLSITTVSYTHLTLPTKLEV